MTAADEAIRWTQDKCRPIAYRRAGLGDWRSAVCEKCGSTGPLSMHHRRKRSQGGGWEPSNIVILCGNGTMGCHGWVETNPTAANAEGWSLVGRDPDGSKVPIRHWRIGWARVLLDDQGCLIPIDW